MHLALLFILMLSTAYTSFAIPPPVCDTGEAVCCDGDLLPEEVGVYLGCEPYSDKLTKCERASMRHCCLYIIGGAGIGCGKTAARECPVPGFETRKRHLRSRATDGCSPPANLKQSEVNTDYPVADLTPNLNGDNSPDMFLADGASPDISSTDPSFWGPTPLNDVSTTASLGGGQLPASNYGDGTLSLALLDSSSGGINDGSDMFLSG